MKSKEIHSKNNKELIQLLLSKKEELNKLKIDTQIKKVKNYHKIKEIKKDIARILTIINEKKYKINQ